MTDTDDDIPSDMSGEMGYEFFTDIAMGFHTDALIIIEREPVKEEIMAYVQPWKSNNVCPKLSASELIVMAILCSDEVETDRDDIMKWILHHIGYYTEKLINAFTDGLTLTRGAHDFNEVVDGFDQAFNQYDAPLRAGEEGYIVDIDAGRIFLSNWLVPARQGIFPFLTLPNTVVRLGCLSSLGERCSAVTW